MPVVFREAGFRFHFFSNEGDPREPVHIHAAKDAMDAKLWLYPTVSVAYKDGCDGRTIRRLIRIVEARRPEIESAWNSYFA